MFGQIADRKRKEERQEGRLRRRFPVFFVVMAKRVFCIAVLAAMLAGVAACGRRADFGNTTADTALPLSDRGSGQKEEKNLNSYSDPKPDQDDLYELLTARDGIIRWPETAAKKYLLPDTGFELEDPFSNMPDRIWQQEEEQQIVREILEQEEISMLLWEVILKKGEDWENLKLETEILEDRVSLQLSDERETIDLTVFPCQMNLNPEDAANESKWDELEALWRQCEAIFHKEGIEDYERFSWHMTDRAHKEKDILGKFILYRTKDGKQGFFRQNDDLFYRIESRSGSNEDDLGGGVPLDIQETKVQIQRLSIALEEKEESDKWEEPESGLYGIMLWKLWNGRMPAWGVGWDSISIWNAIYDRLPAQDGMPAWEEIAGTEYLSVALEEDEDIETFSDLKKLPHLKGIEVIGRRQNQINFDLTEEMIPELRELSVRYVELENLLFLEDFPQLKVLYVTNCGLEDISGIECQKELWDISLFQNKIRDISLLSNCKKAEVLSLAFNEIKDISVLSGLTALTEIGIYGNQISDIAPLQYLKKLEKVNLNANQITDLSPLKDLTELTGLGASYNQISDISPLEGMTKLDNLALDYNEIQDIRVIQNMPRMRYLGLYHNQIKDFSPVIGLTQLLFFSVGENPGQDHIGDLVFVPRLVLGSGFSEEEGMQQAAQEVLNRYYPEEGLTAEDMAMGDLNGDGIEDLAITGLGEITDDVYDNSRKIYLFLKQADGSFKTLPPLDTLGPYSGGIYGDPYEGILITDGKLVVKVYGGSNWRWGFTDIYEYENGEMKEKWGLRLEEFVYNPGYDFSVTNVEDGSCRQYVIAGEWEGESRQLLLSQTGNALSLAEKEFAEKYAEYQESIGIILPEFPNWIGVPTISTGWFDYQLHDRLYDTKQSPKEVLLMAAEKYLDEYRELPVPCYTSQEILENYKILTGVDVPETLIIGKDKKDPDKVKILTYKCCEQKEDGSFEHQLSLYAMEHDEEVYVYWDEADRAFTAG